MYIGQIAKQSYDLYSQFFSRIVFSFDTHLCTPLCSILQIVMCSHHFSGGNCVAVVCIFFFFFAIFKFYVHSASTTYVIRKFFSNLYCNMPLLLMYDIPFVM